jgi:hypothetical protein
MLARGSLPVTGRESPGDIEALLGPASAVLRENELHTLEYWPDVTCLLWRFTWFRGEPRLVEANYREQAGGGTDLPDWPCAFASVPTRLAEFERALTGAGARLARRPQEDGFLLVEIETDRPELSQEAVFLDGQLIRLHFAWSGSGSGSGPAGR